MNCPQCGEATYTKDTRVRGGNRFRRRICGCGHVFTSIETLYVRQKPKKKPPKKKPRVKREKAEKKVFVPVAEAEVEWSIPVCGTTPEWVRRIAEAIQ